MQLHPLKYSLNFTEFVKNSNFKKHKDMKNRQLFNTLASLLFISLFFSCKKDTPVIPNEEELITTLTYTLVPSGGGQTVTLSFQDLDGDGGNAPTITGGTVAANTSYAGSLNLLNEAESPAESITEEIAEEDAEHQVFYASSGINLDISYADRDGNNKPVGLNTLVNTGDTGSGNLTITLRHEPNKSAEGVENGLIENAGGETDIEVTFPITIQ